MHTYAVCRNCNGSKLGVKDPWGRQTTCVNCKGTGEVCSHIWRGREDEYSNEFQESVICQNCAVLGERDRKTATVVWPVT